MACVNGSHILRPTCSTATILQRSALRTKPNTRLHLCASDKQQLDCFGSVTWWIGQYVGSNTTGRKPFGIRGPTTHSSRRRYAASKIVAILEADFGLTVCLIYQCGAAQC